MRSTTVVSAEPEPLEIAPARTALIVIDMQRDFLEPGGFGETLGNDVSLLSVVIEPLSKLLARARQLRMLIIHTREGHRPDLSDAPRAKHGGRCSAASRTSAALTTVETLLCRIVPSTGL